MDLTTPPAQTAAPRVMLLCVWLDAQAVWHARVVEEDAQAHEFSSPFDLAQFLSRHVRAPPPPGVKGLR